MTLATIIMQINHSDAIGSATRVHNRWFGWSIVAGVIFAIGTGVLAYFVWASGNAVQNAVQNDADARISLAKEGAEKAVADAEKARQAAAEANARSAALEKETAVAKLQLAQLEQRLAWRTLQPQQKHVLIEKMRLWASVPNSEERQRVAVFSTNAQTEAAVLADEIAEALGPNGAGWSINRFPVMYGSNYSVTGVGILIGNNNRQAKLAEDLARTLASVGIFAHVLPDRRITTTNPDDNSDSSISVMVGDRF